MVQSRFYAAIAFASLAIAATALAAPQLQTTAQGRAEAACAEHGVRPNSAAWELCLSHVTRAYEWGELGLASQLARAAGAARENCMDYGLQPNSPSFRTCIDREVEVHSDLLILGDERTGENIAETQ